MADLLKTVREIFWAESFWLPGNSTWEELKNTDNGIYHPQLSDLLVPLYLSVIVTLLRIVFERFLAAPFGRSFGLKAVVKKAPANHVLENAFKKKKTVSDDNLQSLVKQTDMTARQIERWFRVRRNQERTPVLKKLCESSWKGLFYLGIFWYGVYIHLDKSWFYDTSEAWNGWPHHNVTSDIYWYYMIEGGFYVSLLYSLFTDNKRKDFTEMIVHHFATILLMFLSWMNNFVRIGTLVLLVHDAVDSWLEIGKVCKYIRYENTCGVLFFIFMVIWVITRMVLFPFRIIHSTMFEALEILYANQTIQVNNIYIVYNVLLCTLQVLHIIWFYYICLIARDVVFTGHVEKDSRSSMESDSASEREKEGRTPKAINSGQEANGDKNAPQINGVTKGQAIKRK